MSADPYLTCFTEMAPETEERDLEAEREAKALDAERQTLRDETTLRGERRVWTAPSTHRLPKPFTVTSQDMYTRLMRWKGLLCLPEREQLSRLACASIADYDHSHHCAAGPGWTNRPYYLGVTFFEWSDPSTGSKPGKKKSPSHPSSPTRIYDLTLGLAPLPKTPKKLSFPSSLTRTYDLTLGLALPRALWLRASIQAKARDLAAAGFSRRDIHRWHNRWIPQKKAARPPRSLDVVSTPRGGQPIETIRRPKEKPRHRGVDPPAVLPLVVRTALRLMECHRPTRRPPPTRPDPPRARPAQTYAPTQPHPPRFMHTTREEWRDLLFLSYEFHAKRERWRSC